VVLAASIERSNSKLDAMSEVKLFGNRRSYLTARLIQEFSFSAGSSPAVFKAS
jgi:hypothetical protein